MLALPVTSSPLRELFDIADLVAFGTKKAFPASFPVAKLAAQRAFANSAVRSVNSICIRASGELWLVRFGPKGGHKKLWNFGILNHGPTAAEARTAAEKAKEQAAHDPRRRA